MSFYFCYFYTTMKLEGPNDGDEKKGLKRISVLYEEN